MKISLKTFQTIPRWCAVLGLGSQAAAALLLCAMSFGPSTSFASSLCGNQNCQPETGHGIQVYQTDGNGHYWQWSDVTAGGLAGVEAAACANKSAYQSGGGVTITYSNCSLLLPIPEANAGGTTASIGATGSWQRTYTQTGQLIDSGQGGAPLEVGCVDSVNPDRQAIGVDGQCYCKSPMLWDPARVTCIEVRDVWKDDCIPCREMKLGNPIAPLVAAKLQREALGIFIGRESLDLVYDTRRRIPYLVPPTPISGFVGLSAAPAPAFGASWTSSAHKALYIQRSRFFSSTGFVVLAFRGDGRVLSFTHPNATTYVPDNPAARERLEPVFDGSGSQTSVVRLIDAAGNVELYDLYGGVTTATRGNLLSISYAGGGSINYTYDLSMLAAVPYQASVLVGMTDHSGRTVKFRYEPSDVPFRPRVKEVVTPDGQVIAMAYNAANQLERVTWPDGKYRTYVYERPDLPWALTGVIDENNSRLSTFTYDASGRAIGTELAGGVEQYSATYGVPPMLSVTETFVDPVLTRVHQWLPPQGVTAGFPGGASRTLSAIDSNGTPLLAGQSQPAGSGSAASSDSATYDSNGNLRSKNDFLGLRTCYGPYDTKNRETVRIEGLPGDFDCAVALAGGAPAPSRKVATTWHPDWRMPYEVVEPLRKQTTVYHGLQDPFNGNATASCTSAPALPSGKPLPVVCKQVEQAMINGVVDGSVATRTNRYTYDGLGQVLTSVDAAGKTTTFAYYPSTVFSGGPYDASIDSVSLLLHANGGNGATVVSDDSPTHRAVTLVGNAKISTDPSTNRSQFGGSSLEFDGTGDYVSIPYSLDFAFGSGNFTIETFIYKRANNPNASRIWNPNGDLYDGINMGIDASGNFAVYASTSCGSWTHQLPVVAHLDNDRWYHLAVVRSGGSLFAFVDGTMYTVTTALGATALCTNATSGRVIGGQAGINRGLDGFIDEFRITKGVARYTAAFTAPAQEFVHATPSPADVGHSVGDLQSITNAAGHVTQFGMYDRAGRVRQMTDPKGVVTEITYTARGLVSTVTVTPNAGNARTTTYTHDNVGQVTGVTLPDGTSLSYSYDAAHRLIGVTDARGNAVTYNLDTAGNRIAEEVRDPTGTLQRSISRSFDALNRLRQVTGAAM